MRFLVDAQLPPALARWLVSRGHVAQHVQDAGLTHAQDAEIWRHAQAEQTAIVTKDADFAVRSSLAAAGPGIVWVRLGNVRNAALLASFERVLSSIERELVAGERLVEVT